MSIYSYENVLIISLIIVITFINNRFINNLLIMYSSSRSIIMVH